MTTGRPPRSRSVRSDRLTGDDLGTWRGFLRWSEGVRADVAQSLGEHAGLSTADYEILKRLREAEGSWARQELEKSLQWSPSRLSHQLARMEARGLIRRVGTGHGRQIDVELREDGRQSIIRADAIHAAAVRSALLDRLPADVAAFLRAQPSGPAPGPPE